MARPPRQFPVGIHQGTSGEETWSPQFVISAAAISVRLTQPDLEATAPIQSSKDRRAFERRRSAILNAQRSPRTRQLVRWAQRANMVSVLTDRPYREKLGWLEQYHQRPVHPLRIRHGRNSPRE
jgi:hypothetical protein